MITISNTWPIFFAALAVMLLSTWLMARQTKLFFTKDPVKRKFSMLEMEFPAKSYELENLINGIYYLPEAQQTVKAVKNQLLLDYLLFIPATYGGIYVLCMHIANNMQTAVGQHWFAGLAWAQTVAFVLDYAENTYLWNMVGKSNIPIPKPNPSQPEVVSPSFKRMQVLEVFKWSIPLVGAVCCLSVLAYFWLSGQY